MIRVTAGNGPVEAVAFADALRERLDAESWWCGTHLLEQALRGRGARKRWFAWVEMVEEVALSPLRMSDLDVRFDRAGGAGGQHVNTCSSAVRVVHRPTGLAVRETGQRSQHQNRRRAIQRVREQLENRFREANLLARTESWRAGSSRNRGDPDFIWRRTRRGGLELTWSREPVATEAGERGVG